MSDNRIVLRLNDRIAFERDFGIQYRNVPRARRQEWVRSILIAGLSGIEGIARGASSQAPVAAANDAPAPRAVVAAPVVAAPAQAPVAAASPAVVKPVVKSKTQAGDLKGFFPVTNGTNP